MKFLIAFVIAALLAVGTFFAADRFWLKNISNDESFRRTDIPLASYDLLDLGVVDFNDDNFLDIFTLNHSAQQSLLKSDGRGNFVDVFRSQNLDQSTGFPGLEDSNKKPLIQKPGLYIYRQERWLHIQAHETAEMGVIKGALTIGWPVIIQKSVSSLKVKEDKMPSGATLSRLTFALADGESLVLNGVEDIAEVPHLFSFDNTVALSSIFIGLPLTNPENHEFELNWRDRHGMAWADINGDDVMDVYIVRGGIKGGISRHHGPIADELFVSENGRYRDRIAETGITKKLCPSRQVAWIDFDGDRDLDVYISCGRGKNPDYPDQLLRRNADGRYAESAVRQGLRLPFETRVAWLDADNDGDMDLLAADHREFNLYTNQSGQFQKLPIARNGPRFENFSLADYDNDGDLDVYAADASDAALLNNTRGQFTLTSPSTIGLPNGAKAAAWVDYDNDGLVDLYTIPGGLFKQGADHRFHETGLLKLEASMARIQAARATWFDVDNDGARDLLFGTLFTPNIPERIFYKAVREIFDLENWGISPHVRWSTGIFHNSLPRNNHWLQVKLIGNAENRHAIGARVYVSTPDATQLQQVGAADGSHFSQGHYRLYFGLGKSDSIDDLKIVWPDGHVQELSDIQIDRMITLRYDSSP